jgi:hypothetical protein
MPAKLMEPQYVSLWATKLGPYEIFAPIGAGGMGSSSPLNEGCGFRRPGARLSAVLTRFGRQRGQAVSAIAQRPIQQRVHRDLSAM